MYGTGAWREVTPRGGDEPLFPLRPRPRRWVHFGHLRLYGKDGLSKFHTTDETGPRPNIRGFSSTFRLFAARRSCGQAPADRTRAFTLLSEVHFFHLDSEFGLNITAELPPSSEMQELGEDASDCATSGERCPDSSPIPSTSLDSFPPGCSTSAGLPPVAKNANQHLGCIGRRCKRKRKRHGSV